MIRFMRLVVMFDLPVKTKKQLNVYRTFITVNGRRIYAKNYGKRAFRIPIKTR